MLFRSNPPIGFGDYDDVPRPIENMVDNTVTADTVFSTNLTGYYKTCSDKEIISTRVNGSWNRISDTFPEKGYYLDDKFIFIDTYGFGCDALSCIELPKPYSIELVEHTKVGEKTPPPDSSSTANTVSVYQTIPLKGEIKVDIQYFSDEHCGDKKQFSTVLKR